MVRVCVLLVVLITNLLGFEGKVFECFLLMIFAGRSIS